MEYGHKIIYSIDIGAKGAMSVFKNDRYIKTLEYSSIDEWHDEIYWSIREVGRDNIIIVIEKVHAMPKQGVVSMFNFGRKLGEVEAMCKILEIEPIYVSPREWKSYFNMIGSHKNFSCIKALELEPKLKCYGKKGGCLDGIADSYLIGRYFIENKLIRKYK